MKSFSQKQETLSKAKTWRRILKEYKYNNTLFICAGSKTFLKLWNEHKEEIFLFSLAFAKERYPKFVQLVQVGIEEDHGSLFYGVPGVLRFGIRVEFIEWMIERTRSRFIDYIPDFLIPPLIISGFLLYLLITYPFLVITKLTDVFRKKKKAD